MAVAYDLSFTGKFCVDPQDFLDYSTEDDLDAALEDLIEQETGMDYEFLDEWSMSPEFYEEWRRLKEEELQERQEEFDEND